MKANAGFFSCARETFVLVCITKAVAEAFKLSFVYSICRQSLAWGSKGGSFVLPGGAAGCGMEDWAWSTGSVPLSW